MLAPATHKYEVRARDAAGNVSDFSNSETASVFPPDAEAPTIPANLQATGFGNGNVDLTWDASLDNVGVTSYRVYRGTDADRKPERRHDVVHRHRASARQLQLHRAGRGRGRERL